MLTEPAALATWWGPEGFTTPEAMLDLQPGGSYRLTMKPPDGEPFHLAGQFLEVDPPHRLVYTFRWKSPRPTTVKPSSRLPSNRGRTHVARAVPRGIRHREAARSASGRLDGGYRQTRPGHRRQRSPVPAGRAYTGVMDERPRILVVEDDAPLAAMLGELLRDEGYDVETAHNGQRALHLGLTHQFDALLLDRGLPAIEGLDVLARLRRQAWRRPPWCFPPSATLQTKWRAWTAGPKTIWPSRSTSASCWPGCVPCCAAAAQ